ncbi:MAG TPA: hypothetical protein ENL04_02325 [Sulfuricurvum sp.]|nr:hypothetical protein [Sulfuricurvum sp.]
MAVYRQNSTSALSIAEKIAKMLYRDIDELGDSDRSIYRQSEEEIMLWYLIGHHALAPDTTIGQYATLVEEKKVPGLITLSTSIHKMFKNYGRDLFEKRGWEKHELQTDADVITHIATHPAAGRTDHADLLRYYDTAHGIGGDALLFSELLRPAGAREIPSIHVARLQLMRARKKVRACA